MVVHSLFVKFNSNLWINFGIKQPPAAYFFWLASSSQASCTSPRRKRQASFISLLVLSKMQTLALVCILVL